MKIFLIVAASENNVIGRNNKLLWTLPNDMAFFKNTTWGMPVIMGRKTLDSLGKPLKGRTNIVISRNTTPEGTVGVHSLKEGIEAASATDARQCFVIGGGEIFSMAMPVADKIYLTRVHTNVEGDTWFPEINPQVWTRTGSNSFGTDARHAVAYTFETWERKSSTS
jgi:dihydrofolate reductase